ncbi:MAG: hypothetical protein ACXVI9_08760 [Mucilaginibacter sp.]
MATLKPEIHSNWATSPEHTGHLSLWNKFTAFADRQEERKVIWFFLALTVQGIFFLPMPAALMYYYNASIGVLLITLFCFFTNIIAYMGGAGIRAVLLLSVISILIQVAVLIFVMV